MSDKIPTAEEYCNQTGNGNLEGGWEDSHQYQQVKKLMIEFAQLHVEAALKAVYEEGISNVTSWDGNPYTGEGSDYLDLNKILACYTKENIK